MIEVVKALNCCSITSALDTLVIERRFAAFLCRLKEAVSCCYNYENWRKGAAGDHGGCCDYIWLKAIDKTNNTAAWYGYADGCSDRCGYR